MDRTFFSWTDSFFFLSQRLLSVQNRFVFFKKGVRPGSEAPLFMFHPSHIFVFWFLVFWFIYLHDLLSIFSCLTHLTLQNVNKENVIFLYFCNFVTKSDQKPKTKNGMNETLL